MSNARRAFPDRRERACIAAMSCAAFAAVAMAAFKPLWTDDYLTLHAIRLPWLELVRERATHNHMPGYFLLLKAWTALAGTSEPALRFVSGVFSLGAAALVFQLARRTWGNREALMAGWFFALSPLTAYTASLARMYSLLLFLTLASMILYLRILEGGGRRFWIGHFFVSVAGLLAHVVFAAVLAVQALHAFVVGRHVKLRPFKFVALAAAPFVLVSPLIAVFLSSQRKMRPGAFDLPSPTKWLRYILRFTFGDYELDLINRDWSRFLSVPLLLALFVLIIVAARRARRRLAAGEGTERRAALVETLLPCWYFGGCAAIYAAAAFNDDILREIRYYVIAFGAAPLCVAAAARALPPRRARIVFVGLALAVPAWFTVCFAVSPGSGLRQSVRRIAANMNNGDGLLVADRGPAEEAFSYYGRPDIKPLAIGQRQDDKETMLRYAAEASEGKDRLWVLIFQAGKLPLAETLDRNGDYERIEDWRVGDCRGFCYRVRKHALGATE